MKLDDYLAENGIPRVRFTEKIGVGPACVTALCNGRFWPRREIMRRIVEATEGAVGPSDFLYQQPPLCMRGRVRRRVRRQTAVGDPAVAATPAGG